MQIIVASSTIVARLDRELKDRKGERVLGTFEREIGVYLQKRVAGDCYK